MRVGDDAHCPLGQKRQNGNQGADLPWVLQGVLPVDITQNRHGCYEREREREMYMCVCVYIYIYILYLYICTPTQAMPSLRTVHATRHVEPRHCIFLDLRRTQDMCRSLTTARPLASGHTLWDQVKGEKHAGPWQHLVCAPRLRRLSALEARVDGTESGGCNTHAAMKTLTR